MKINSGIRYFLILLLLHSFLAAQQNSLSFRWISFSAGLGVNTNLPADTLSFQRISSGDHSLLHPGFLGMQKEKDYRVNAQGEIKLAAGFNFRKQKDHFISRRLLRVGLSINYSQFISAEYSRTNYVRYDTTVDAGGTFYYDSVFVNKLRYTSNQRLTGIEAALLFYSDTSKLYGFYTGISLTQYFGLNNIVAARYSEHYSIQQTNTSGQLKDKLPEQHLLYSEEADVRGKFSMVSRISIPVALSLRLARTKKFLRKIQLFGEVMPCLDITTFPGVRTYVNATALWQGGIRYDFK